MSGAQRGPSGDPRPPPDWLPDATLPTVTVPAFAPFVRIHRTGRPAVFYSPGQGPPLGRFDSAAGRFGVLYMAFGFEGAFAETILRNPARRLIGREEIALRSATALACSRQLRLVQMHGPGLQVLGVDNAITTGRYELCGVWADALFGHRDAPDGIAYASRHDPEQICVALFSRPITMIARRSVPLSEMPAEVGAALRHYGKGLDLGA